MNIFEITSNNTNNEDEKKSLLEDKYYNSDISFHSNYNILHDVVRSSLENQYSINTKTSDKYRKYGITWNPKDAASGILDKQLADAQSNWEKLRNALDQTVVNEIALGTLTGFADLYDIVLGRVLKSDEDYQNPVSRYLEGLQEQFRESHAIYQDPTKTGWKDWSDFGWWMNNFPSIMSSLTLLVPGAGVGKATSYVGRLGGKAIRKGVAFSRRTAKGADRLNRISRSEKLGKFENWINRPNIGTVSNRIFENGATALSMRLMENYQEGRQVYNEMMDDISSAMKDMSPEERADLIERNRELLKANNVNIDDDNQVARIITKEAADKTFKLDMANLLFDVIQVSTLGNPLKLPKNLRQTYKVAKHQRESKILTALGDAEGAKYLANRTAKQKTKDFLSDFSKAKWLISSALSEGVEEAVNYVSQQEGIHYGKLMLNPEEVNLDNSDRWLSYLNNSELYESAFWGILGGIMFEGGGGQLKRVYNATANTIKNNKNNNDKTLEGREKATWKKEYQTTENIIRTGEIDSRYQNVATLKERRDIIFNQHESPFEDDSVEPGTIRKLTTQLERDAAWERAIDDFITNQTFLAIDAGNYDLLKDFLTDTEVRKVIENTINSDKSNNAKISVDDLIKRMDEIERMYTDNLITVNSLSSQIGEVPMEYVNIIARDNTKAQIKANRIQSRIDRYESSARANEFRFEKSLEDVFGEPTLDYKTAVKLVTAITYLRELRKAKEDILKNDRIKGSIDGQMRLNSINSKIEAINNYVSNLKPAITSITTDEKLYSVINTLFTTHLSLDEDSDENIDFTKALATRDIKSINKITGRDFELTDDDLIKVFGEGNADGVFYKLSDEILSHFGVDKSKGDDVVLKFEEAAPDLKDDYDTIAGLEISKLLEESKMFNTLNNIRHRVESLNNTMNKARVVAISNSRDIIIDNAKKYGRDKMNDYVFNNIPIADMSEGDKRNVDEAIVVLNLTNPNNAELADALYWNILLGDYEGSVEKAEEKENSSTNEKSNTTDKVLDQDKPLTEQPKPNTSQNTGTESEIPSENDTEIEPINPIQNIQISSDVDNVLSFSMTSDDNDSTFPFREVTNNTDRQETDRYELALDDDSVSKNKKKSLVDNFGSELFNDYDKNNTNDYEITKNPVLTKDENGNIFISEKGEIRYKTPNQTTTSTNTNLSTGEEDKTIDETPTEEEAKKEQENLEKAQRELTFRRNTFKRLRIIAESMRNDNKSKEEIIDAVNKELSRIRNEEGFVSEYNDIVESVVNLITNKYDLVSVAQALDDFRSSTVVEKSLKESEYTEEFINFANKLIEEYCKANGREKGRNNKYYINFESFIRNLNSLYKGYEEGSAAYESLRAFLTSEYNDICIVVDDPNDPNLLDNARKDAETRLRERIGDLDKYKAGIDELFKENSKSFRKAFDELEIGEKLKVGYDDFGRITLSHKSQVVGILGKPEKTIDGNGFVVTNKGWITDTYNNVKDSKLRKHLSDLANNNKELNDIIFSILYDKIDDNKHDVLIEKAYNILLKTSNKFLDTDNYSSEEIVDWICNLWRYKNLDTNFADITEDRGIYVDRFLDMFFEKLYKTYDAVSQLYTKKGNFEVEVANINEGEIIRVVKSEDINLSLPRQSRNNYNTFTQSNKAFAKPDKCEVGVVVEPGVLTLEDNRNFEHTKLGVRGTVHVTIPNRNGKPNFVIATSVRADDDNKDFKSSDAYEIIEESRKYLNSALDRYLQNKSTENFDILVDVINKLFGGVGITGLYGGVNISTKNGIIISKSKSKKKIKQGVYIYLDKNNLKFEINGNNKEGVQSGRIEGNEQQIKDIINALFNTCFFNVDFDFFTDVVDSRNGLIGYKDGKFIIQIQGKPYKYDNPSQAFIKGGLLRVNTKIEDGSNYRRKGEKNQGANAILEVKFNAKSSSPVESSDEEPTVNNTIVEQITGEDILENEDSNTAVDKLVELALPNLNKNDKKELQDLGLLPKSIIFAEELKDKNGNDAVAQVTISSEEVKVSRLWLNMFDGIGNYKDNKDFYRKQAIRKLIHEQVHVRIAENNREEILKQIKQIYDEFEAAFNNFSKEEQDIYKDYLFKNKTDINERFEEFLVESFTSKALAEKLNQIEANWDGISIDIEKGNPKNIKKTLWNKIIKLISEIFNYISYKKNGEPNAKFEIKKENLLQKELYALAGALNTEGEIVETIKETQSKTTEEKEDDDFLNDMSYRGTRDGNIKNSTVIENLVPENVRKQRQETEKEMQDIKSKSIADGTFMKAPNGNPTNLTERQWLQVRTKAFKDWFGDWEKGLTITQDKASYYRGQYDEPTIDDDGNLILYGRKDSLYEKAGYKIDKGVSATRDMQSAIEYGDGQLETRYNLAEASLDESERESILNNGYYVIQFKDDVSNETIKEAGEVKLVGDVIIPKGSYIIEHYIGGELVETIGSIGNDASKVVDDNGEPLVVYRGEEEEHNIKRNIGFYTTDKNYADSFQPYDFVDGRYIPKGHLGAYFLNIRSLRFVRNGISFDTIESQIQGDEITLEENPNYKMPDGYYGHDIPDRPEGPSEGMEYVTTNHNQIKSATDNVGTFSRENDDIRYSTIIESAPTYLSLDSFLNTINPELAPEVARMIENGELSIICK